MNKERSSYRQIMKAISLFGGVQVINILIRIIRSKVVAVLLGPAGMGIVGLLNSTIELIGGLTNVGLGTSAVKDVVTANSMQDNRRIAITVSVLRRLIIISGTLGTLLVIILSPWLSQLTFGNKEYTFAFIWISITLLCNQLSKGQLVLLQGMRKLQLLAKANVLGSLFGLVITLPLYYIYGINGIVPGIIGTSLIALLLSWYFSKKVPIKTVSVTYSQIFSVGKNMLRMGFMISLSGLLSVGSSYIVRIFISRTGSVEHVGLYNAGFAIINSYVGLIFSAMATDYYPRLSAVAHDNKLSRQTINQQAEIAILILAPILIIFLVFINWIVTLLYSRQFIAINAMIYWAALGMFFKAASWSIGFILVAKGASKTFFWSEAAANTYVLGFNILGYMYGGLEGLGISFLISYIFGLIQIYLIAKIKFDFSYDRVFIIIFIIQFSLAVASFLAVKFLTPSYAYFIGVILILISCSYSLMELDKRLGLKPLIQKIRFHRGN